MIQLPQMTNELPKSNEIPINEHQLIEEMKEKGLIPEVHKKYTQWVKEEEQRRALTRPNTQVERVNFTMKKGIVLFEGGIFDSALIEFHVADAEAEQNTELKPEEKKELLSDINKWIIDTREELEK